MPFLELADDPQAMVHRIDRYFGLGTTDEALLRSWLDTERADKRGSHRYSAAMFGLQPEEIRERFAPYIERFEL